MGESVCLILLHNFIFHVAKPEMQKPYNTIFFYIFSFRCLDCKRWEKWINQCKNFSLNWIRPGSGSVKKDSILKHVNGEQHKMAVDLSNKSKMGAIPYQEAIIRNSPIGCIFQKMCERDRDNLRMKFNLVYYLLKQERPFSDYPQLLKLQTKNRVKPIGSCYLHEQAAAMFAEVIGDVHHRSLKEKLAKARYYSVLNDESSDTSVSEKELVYVLFLDDGKPKIEFLSIEDVKNADTAGIQECIAESFQRIGITKFSEKMVGLNVDGASINMGKFTGLGTRLKGEAPSLQYIVSIIAWNLHSRMHFPNRQCFQLLILL